MTRTIYRGVVLSRGRVNYRLSIGGGETLDVHICLDGQFPCYQWLLGHTRRSMGKPFALLSEEILWNKSGVTKLVSSLSIYPVRLTMWMDAPVI